MTDACRVNRAGGRGERLIEERELKGDLVEALWWCWDYLETLVFVGSACAAAYALSYSWIYALCLLVSGALVAGAIRMFKGMF